MTADCDFCPVPAWGLDVDRIVYFIIICGDCVELCPQFVSSTKLGIRKHFAQQKFFRQFDSSVDSQIGVCFPRLLSLVVRVAAVVDHNKLYWH